MLLVIDLLYWELFFERKNEDYGYLFFSWKFFFDNLYDYDDDYYYFIEETGAAAAEIGLF